MTQTIILFWESVPECLTAYRFDDLTKKDRDLLYSCHGLMGGSSDNTDEQNTALDELYFFLQNKLENIVYSSDPALGKMDYFTVADSSAAILHSGWFM